MHAQQAEPQKGAHQDDEPVEGHEWRFGKEAGAGQLGCHVAPGASAKNFPRARVEGPVQLATHDSEPLYDTRPVTVKRYAMFDKILQTLSICSALAVVVLATGAACAQELTDRDVAALSKLATTGTVEQKDVAVQMLLDRGKTDIVPSLIFAMRCRRDNQVIPNALKTVTDAEITGWQTVCCGRKRIRS